MFFIIQTDYNTIKMKQQKQTKKTPCMLVYLTYGWVKGWKRNISVILVLILTGKVIYLEQKSECDPVQFSCSVASNSLRPHEPQHARPPCPSPTAGVYPNPCPLSRCWHPAISSSFIPFSSCPQSLPASGSFQMSQLFTSGGQSIGVSTSVIPVNTQDRSPLDGLVESPWQSKGLSFSNTTVQNHQFFGAQLSL